jgi:hypothetical protein
MCAFLVHRASELNQRTNRALTESEARGKMSSMFGGRIQSQDFTSVGDKAHG